MNRLCFKRNFAIITFTSGWPDDWGYSVLLIPHSFSFLLSFHSAFVSLISIVRVQVFSSNSCVDDIRSQFEYIFAMSDFFGHLYIPCLHHQKSPLPSNRGS